MAYDERLEVRIAHVLEHDGVVFIRKYMFGGVAFMVRGHMTVRREPSAEPDQPQRKPRPDFGLRSRRVAPLPTIARCAGASLLAAR